MKIYETVTALNGNEVTRIKSSLFYWSGLLCIPAGIFVLKQEVTLGAFLILTACPCLLLYPLVRFLFGGKDSVAAIVGTVITEEVLKSKVREIGNKKRRKF